MVLTPVLSGQVTFWHIIWRSYVLGDGWRISPVGELILGRSGARDWGLVHPSQQKHAETLMILLVEEILHQLIGSLSLYLGSRPAVAVHF